MKKLSQHQLALLRECCKYSIMDDSIRKRWYRLGGHGDAPLRYNRNTMWALSEVSLVVRNGGYRATKAGQKLVAENQFLPLEQVMPEVSGSRLTLENYGCQNGFMTQVCCDMTTTPHHMEPLDGWRFDGWCASPPFTRTGPHSLIHTMAVVMIRESDEATFWWHYTKGKFFVEWNTRAQ